MPLGEVILHGCNKHNYSNYIESIGDFSMDMEDDGFVTKLTVFTKAIFHSSIDVKFISGVTMDNWKKQKLNLNCEIVTNSKLNKRVQIQYLFETSKYKATVLPN